MRVVFMGTPEFAVPSLEALLRSEETIVGVVTQPDRPKGRGQALAISPVKQVGQRAGLPILQPVKMKDHGFLETLRSWQADLIAVAAFGRILPGAILTMPPRGCINVHASLLPKYRGAGPIQWAIMNGESETGITTMQMDEGMDTGDILLQERVLIEPADTAGSLSTKLAEVGAGLLLETISRLKESTLTPRSQDHSQATVAPLLKKEDGAINWHSSAAELANKVRGLSPWPGAYTYLKDSRWIIWQASAISEGTGQPPFPAVPGSIVEARKDGILVATGDGILIITELQPANARRMTAAQYLAGHSLPPGLALGSASTPSAKS